ncbi:MAG: metallophosphoesterase [Spirochaetota bacterium]
MSGMRSRLSGAKRALAIIWLTMLRLSGEQFILAVIPDPQHEVCVGPAGDPVMFTSQMQWIADNSRASNIAFVISVGDNVHYDPPDHYMWTFASNGYRLLENAGVPFALVVGNHDTHAVRTNSAGMRDPENTATLLRETPEFNAYFPASRFTAQKGRFESGKSDNAYYTFAAGGCKWMVIVLELWARQIAVDWAKSVLADPAYADHNVIIATHSHLTSKGVIEQHPPYGDLSPQSVFDQLITRYPNVRFVFSGHVGKSAWRDDRGVNGNHIYQILTDYQEEKKGNGWMRLIAIDTSAGIVSAWVYSPYVNKARDDASRFMFTGASFIPPNGH